jgi:hypothetical protein
MHLRCICSACAIYLLAVAAGGLAGVLAYAAIHPFDTLKSIVQSTVSTGGPQSASAQIKLFPQVIRQHGIIGLYRGIGPVLVQAVPENAAALYTYEMALHFLEPNARAYGTTQV